MNKNGLSKKFNKAIDDRKETMERLWDLDLQRNLAKGKSATKEEAFDLLGRSFADAEKRIRDLRAVILNAVGDETAEKHVIMDAAAAALEARAEGVYGHVRDLLLGHISPNQFVTHQIATASFKEKLDNTMQWIGDQTRQEVEKLLFDRRLLIATQRTAIWTMWMVIATGAVVVATVVISVLDHKASAPTAVQVINEQAPQERGAITLNVGK